MSALELLGAVWGEGRHSLCAAWPGRRFHTVGLFAQPQQLLVAAARLPHANVWFGLNPLLDELAGGRGGDADVAAVTALAFDLDWADEAAHKLADLPAELEVRARLDKLGDDLAPSIVMHTGHGLQAIWPLDQPVSPDDEGEELSGRMRARLLELGLHVERGDLAGVLRVPGTTNHKVPGALKVCTVERLELGRRFVPEYLRKRLPPGSGTRASSSGTRHQGAGVPTEGQERLFEHLAAHHGAHSPVRQHGTIVATRPGKPARDGTSVSIIIGDQGEALATVFSSSWEGLGPANGDTRRSWVLRDGELVEARKAVDPILAAFDDEEEEPVPLEDDEGKAAGEGTASPSGPPVVNITMRHLGAYVDEVAAKLVATNDPPTLFAHGGGVAELRRDRLLPLDPLGLLDAVERRLAVVKFVRGRLRPEVLTAQALGLALRRLAEQLPPLERLALAPFMRADGTICQGAGYDRKSELFLVDAVDVDVPERPTRAELAAAMAVVDDVLADFPFRDEASRAHAWSLLLTAATRHHYDLAPLHAVSGNNAGVGKGLLVEVTLRPTLGDLAATTTSLPLEAEEQRKSITTALAEGRPAVLWDEAHVLEGRPLAQLLTTRVWHDRLLGANRSVEAPNHLTTVAIGNQMRVLGDLRRRTVLVELESDLADPSSRSGFRHADLKGYVTDHRGELLSSVLTILRAWHLAGRPAGEVIIGSFERWAELVGGVLEFLGITGFGTNRDATNSLDDDALEFGWHLAALVEVFGATEFQVDTVLASFNVRPPSTIDTAARDAGRDLGNLYRRNAGRVYGVEGRQLRLRRAEGHTAGRARWRVEEVV